MIWRIVRSRGFIPIVLILAALLYWKLHPRRAKGHLGWLRRRPRRHPLEHARASARIGRRSALRRPCGSRARGGDSGSSAHAFGHDWVDARFAANDGFRSLGKERHFVGARAHAARPGAGPDENCQQRARRTGPRWQAHLSVRARNARVDFAASRGGRSPGPRGKFAGRESLCRGRAKIETRRLAARPACASIRRPAATASASSGNGHGEVKRATGDAVSGGPRCAQTRPGGSGRAGRTRRRLGAGAIR